MCGQNMAAIELPHRLTRTITHSSPKNDLLFRALCDDEMIGVIANIALLNYYINGSLESPTVIFIWIPLRLCFLLRLRENARQREDIFTQRR